MNCRPRWLGDDDILIVMAARPRRVRPSAPKKLSGRPSRYRGKVRERPIVMTMTPDGHTALAEGQMVTGDSIPDYIETLVRESPYRRRSPQMTVPIRSQE